MDDITHSWCLVYFMITSSNGNIFRVTGTLCGEFTGPGEFPTQRPVTRSFDVFFDLRLNKRLSKQPWGWWFETPSWSLWRQCNVHFQSLILLCSSLVILYSYCSCLVILYSYCLVTARTKFSADQASVSFRNVHHHHCDVAYFRQ